MGGGWLFVKMVGGWSVVVSGGWMVVVVARRGRRAGGRWRWREKMECGAGAKG